MSEMEFEPTNYVLDYNYLSRMILLIFGSFWKAITFYLIIHVFDRNFNFPLNYEYQLDNQLHMHILWCKVF